MAIWGYNRERSCVKSNYRKRGSTQDVIQKTKSKVISDGKIYTLSG